MGTRLTLKPPATTFGEMSSAYPWKKSFLLIYMWQWLFISFEKLGRRTVWSIPSMLVNSVFVAAVLSVPQEKP